MIPLTLAIPAGAQKNRLRPFGGRKVHRTFLCFRLTSRREKELNQRFPGVQPEAPILSAAFCGNGTAPENPLQCRTFW